MRILLETLVGGRSADELWGNSQSYSFRCHRKGETPTEMLVYSVNDINFHPVHGTFTTAGSDGSFAFWDKDARSRLKRKSWPLQLQLEKLMRSDLKFK